MSEGGSFGAYDPVTGDRAWSGMPRRLTLPRAAYHRPDQAWQQHEFWSTKFENDVPRLTLSPLWQIAPLDDEIRSVVPTRAKFIAWEFRRTKGGEIIGLVWHPQFWHRERTKETYAVLRDVHGEPLVQFTPYCHQVGLTAERVWTCGGGDRTHVSIGMLVHALDNTSWVGELDKDFYRRPIPVSPMSEEDAASMEGLGD